MKDMQRKRLYRAESQAFRSDGPAADTSFTSLAEMQAFVNKVLRSQWFKTQVAKGRMTNRKVVCKHWPNAHHGKAGMDYATGKYTIWVGERRRSSCYHMYYTLHELAHIVEPANSEAAHGIAFAATYVSLVHHFMGADASKALKERFRHHKVRFAPKAVRAKRVLSEDQKEALRDRLAKAREVKQANAAIRKAEEEIEGLRPWLQTYRDAHACAVRVENQERVDELAHKMALVEGRIATLHAKIGNVKYALLKDKGMIS